MNDPFDELERRLAAAVAARRAAALRHWWRRPLPLVAVGAVAVSAAAGGAIAATRLAPNRDTERAGAKIAMGVANWSQHVAACRPPTPRPGLTLTDGPLPEVIHRELPSLEQPASTESRHAALAVLRRFRNSGTIFDRTLRTIDGPGDARLIVFVAERWTFTPSARDPQACTERQATELDRRLEGQDASVAAAARASLARWQQLVTRPSAPMLGTFVAYRNGLSGGGGGLSPIGKLWRGPTSSTSVGRRGTAHTGIVRNRNAVRLDVVPKHGPHVQVPVTDQMYVFVAPRGSGPLRVREQGPDGTVLRRYRIRR